MSACRCLIAFGNHAVVPVFVLAQQYRTFAARCNAVVVISTALFVVTLSVVLALLAD